MKTLANQADRTAHAEIVPASSAADYEAAYGLFVEYAAEIALSVCYPHPPENAAQIKATYEAPGCGLLLVRIDGEYAGCAGYCPVEGATCEIKRVYLRPSERGLSLGRRLVTEVMDRARGAGYRRMVLSSLATMKAAQALYRSLGFEEAEPFGKPIEGAVYMGTMLPG